MTLTELGTLVIVATVIFVLWMHNATTGRDQWRP